MYENPQAKASQILSDRTAPTFDPTVPQKIDKAVLTNGRMPESVSQAIKAQLPGSSFDELDHIMPLELGGSNNKSNLRLEKGADPSKPYSPSTNTTLTDPIENQLARAAYAGKISVVDAWKQMAKAKGITLPEDGGPVPKLNTMPPAPAEEPGLLEKIGNTIASGAQKFAHDITHPFAFSSGEDFVQKFPGLTQTLADLQTNPASLGSSIKDILSTPFNDVLQASDAFNAALHHLIIGIKSGAPASQDIADGLQAATSFGQGVLTPITTWFNVANKIPIVGSVSKLVFNVPFATLGDVTGQTGVTALQSLSKSQGGPIPDQAVTNLEPAVRAASSLAGQIVGGKAVSIPILETIAKQFGSEGAHQLLGKAQEMAKDREQFVKQSPAAETTPPKTEAPAPKPTAEPPPQPKQPALPSWAPPEAKALETTTENKSAPQPPSAETTLTTKEIPPTTQEPIPPTPKSMPAGALRPIDGIGDTKTRGLSQGVEAKAISAKLTDLFGDLPQYKQMDVADQGARAIDLFQKDPEAAKQIAYGAKAPPKGLTPESVFIAVENDAIERGDAQTLNELAKSRLTSEATTMGQRLRMLAERNPENPTEAIRAVQAAREQAAQAKSGGKNINVLRDKVADDVTNEIKKVSTRPRDWNSFVESITC
jgi:hypothetical protein